MDARTSSLLLLVILGLSAFAGLVFLGNTEVTTKKTWVFENESVDEATRVALEREAQALGDKTIVDYGYKGDGVIVYSYLDKPVPKKLDGREVTELRNETSYTKYIETVEPGNDPVLKMETVIYAQPSFAQDVDGSWKYLEYATTSKTAWDMRPVSLWKRIAESFIQTAFADTATIYSAAGDGYITKQTSCDGAPIEFDPCSCDSFGETQGATDGSSKQDTTTTAFILFVDESYTDINNISQCNTVMYRVFFPFNTGASISSAATISAATLSGYVSAKQNQINDTKDYLTVVRTSQTTHASLALADYDQCGTVGGPPTEGIDSGQRKDLGSISTSAYLAFTLNSTGIGWIAKNGQASNCSASTGYSCFGVREGHDTEQWTWGGAGNTNSVTFSTSEETGTTQDPKLDVTYTVSASALFGPSFVVGSSGRFEVGADGKFELAPF